MSSLREAWTDGSTAAVSALRSALLDALDGGKPLLPLASDNPSAADLIASMGPGEPMEPDTSVIIPTSGSTGAPKGVLLSASALYASADATHDRLGGPGHWLLATPAHYIGGLQVLVRAHRAGTEPALLGTANGFRPAEFATATARLPAGERRYTALVPTQLAKLLDEGGAATEALATFDAIVLGGAALDAGLAQRARAAGVRVVPAYGMSETASGCVYEGVPLDGVRVRIGEDGRIEVGGPTLAHGYRLRPELTARSFADGRFRTSDLGRIDDGVLTVLGRADDVINTGGVKVPAAAVERALLTHPQVAQVCVVGVPDPRWGEAVVAAIVPAIDSDTGPETQLDAEGMRDVVRAAAGVAAVPKRIVPMSELPLRGPGKIDRSAVHTAMSGGI